MGEDGRAIDDVFVQKDSQFGIAQSPRECRLSIEKRAITGFLTVVLDQVEGIEDRGTRRRPSAQRCTAKRSRRRLRLLWR
jgi:hypothetical protein